MPPLIDIINLVVWGAVFITCGCRLAVMSHEENFSPIIYGFSAMGIASLYCGLSWTFGHHATKQLIAAGAGVFCMQVVTRIYWTNGVPEQFKRKN